MSHPLTYLSHYAADPFRAILERAHGIPDGGEDVLSDDPERRRHQKNAHDQGKRAGDERNDVDQCEPPLGLPCLDPDSVGKGVNIRLRRLAPAGHVPVGRGIGLLGLAVGAGADQIDQGVFEFSITIQKRLIRRPVLFGDKPFVSAQFFIQGGLLRLNLLYQLDHGGVIRRYDVGQGQAVNIHDGPPDILQSFLADHAPIHDGSRIGMDVVDAKYRQNIGQHGDQAQQDNGQDQALLKC